MNIIAKKYINGDYFDVQEEEENEEHKPHDHHQLEKKEEDSVTLLDLQTAQLQSEESIDTEDEESRRAVVEDQWDQLVDIAEDSDSEEQAILQELLKERRHSLAHPSSFEKLTKTKSLSTVRKEDLKRSFSAHASISVSIEHQLQLNRIRGIIHSISGFSALHSPDVVRFHTKIIPQCKIKSKTLWKSPNAKSFELEFVLGPLKGELDLDDFICMRLYGRKRRTGVPRVKCYGECSVPIRQLIGEPFKGDLKLLPKAKAGSFKASTLSLAKRASGRFGSSSTVDSNS